jgi:hypothetical protein
MPEVKENKVERMVILVTPSFKDDYTKMVEAIMPEAEAGKEKKADVSKHIRPILEGELALYKANIEK